LIQGLGYGRWSWEPLVPGLAERYRVLWFDNRGIGDSDKPEGPYTARLMADDALQVLDEAGVERAHVLGASLGGMIAQEVAAGAPQRVDKLVLCCTTPGGAATVPMPDVTVRLFSEAATLAPEVALRRFVENALAADAPAELIQITAPTLIVTGTEDNVVDPRNSDVLAERIPEAEVERIDNTGHLFFWEQPDACVRIISEFLQ